ncbi:ATP-binding domain-containing protein [Nocardioides marmoribigeumensis]|uniref:ATP:corrinoid adenosyltransferase n=1 Tax=Nocardioides marmoribigeumensis TaxID=433649 RepID=A0ABU2BY95_9ACTN|nr:ATP-binding domain-containing protein [Nocardioides marmoribigeumensis]MDR7363373.1 ATP:corrinoid adenosyltransferase [Nocardioides marmoribigeumensis]
MTIDLAFGPKLLDDTPAFANGAERVVWQALRDQLGPDDVLGAGVRFTHQGHDREVDLLVGIAGAGVTTVEVKGGSVWLEGGDWCMRRGGEVVTVDPVGQARNGKYALRDYVNADPRWQRRRMRMAHAVALPHTDVPADFATPDCPRDSVFGRGDLDGLVDGLRCLLDQQTGHPPTSAADLAVLADVLGGRFLPQATLLAEAYEREDDAQHLTEQQAMILDAIRHLNRVEVRGGAGSGKTWLAIEQARRLAAQGQRVALVCYSRGLASYFHRRVATFRSHRHRPAYVGLFHGLGEHWGARLPESTDDREGWEVRLPAEMTRLAEDLPENHRFDAVVVDEAQDFSDTWWPALLSALRTEESGIYVFSDESQRVFARFGGPQVSLLPLMLDANLRNTKQIGQTFTDLAPFRMRLRGGDGPDVRFLPCSADEALDLADEAVDDLLDDWRPEDVALLTTGSRHPEQKARQERGQDHYWESFWDEDQVFYGHVLGFKGLERRVVVLAVNDTHLERARERLYVGLSRARDQLVVCGDPDYIREVGGESLWRTLQA